jgi:hypothetical protein
VNDPVSAPFQELAPEDFDGHTEFFSMTAEQRLTWLSEIALFVHGARLILENRE